MLCRNRPGSVIVLACQPSYCWKILAHITANLSEHIRLLTHSSAGDKLLKVTLTAWYHNWEILDRWMAQSPQKKQSQVLNNIKAGINYVTMSENHRLLLPLPHSFISEDHALSSTCCEPLLLFLPQTEDLNQQGNWNSQNFQKNSTCEVIQSITAFIIESSVVYLVGVNTSMT